MDTRPSPQQEADRRRDDGSDVELSAREARQGAQLGHMRWVLRISLALVVIGFVLAWIWI